MSVDAAAAFDPSAEVPDEYDVFCEACGYSLAGLTGDKCPECGAVFEPKELPFARIPWVHRKRLGKVNAYVRTVLMVCFSPGRFSRELCRPVRVSGADAGRFRHATMLLATGLGSFFILATIVVGISKYSPLLTLSPVDLIFLGISAVAGVGALHLFLYFATDMPLFIWRGLPAMRRGELSPVHQYACAPLAFAPLLAALLIYLIIQRESSVTTARLVLTILALAVALIVPVWLWVVALVIMKVSSGAPLLRVLLLGLYLPLHWFLTFTLALMVWVFFVGIERFINDVLHLNSVVFR